MQRLDALSLRQLMAFPRASELQLHATERALRRILHPVTSPLIHGIRRVVFGWDWETKYAPSTWKGTGADYRESAILGPPFKEGDVVIKVPLMDSLRIERLLHNVGVATEISDIPLEHVREDIMSLARHVNLNAVCSEMRRTIRVFFKSIIN